MWKQWSRRSWPHGPIAPFNRVALGQAKRVRFRSRGRGLGSIENKRNDTGLRFAFVHLPREAPWTPALPPAIPAGRGAAKRARRARNRQRREERKLGGHRYAGVVCWQELQLRVRIDWNDPVVAHAACCRVDLPPCSRTGRAVPGPAGQTATAFATRCNWSSKGFRSTNPSIREARVRWEPTWVPQPMRFCPRRARLAWTNFSRIFSPKAEHGKAIRRLQRKLDRQRRAANPHNYDERGRVKKGSKKEPLRWKNSRGYERTRRQYATACRTRAAHRKSLHGKLAHELAAMGDTIILEKNSYRAWQKQFGRSVSERLQGCL